MYYFLLEISWEFAHMVTEAASEGSDEPGVHCQCYGEMCVEQIVVHVTIAGSGETAECAEADRALMNHLNFEFVGQIAHWISVNKDSVDMRGHC